jgi:hypothetical protein
VAVDKDLASSCPSTRIENDCELTFTLSNPDGTYDFVDFTSFNLLNNAWKQELKQEKIVLTGSFEGWIYKFVPTRNTQIEPRKRDSLFLKRGEFQLTLEQR